MQAQHEYIVGEDKVPRCSCGQYHTALTVAYAPADYEQAFVKGQRIFEMVKDFTVHVKLACKLPTDTFWFPSPREIDWQMRTLLQIKDGGVWTIPACGAVLKIEASQRLVTVVLNPVAEQWLFTRVQTVIRLLGWSWQPLMTKTEVGHAL